MKRFLALGFLAAAGCAGAPSSEREPAGVTLPAISVEAVVKNTVTNVKQNFAGSLRSDNQLVASRGKDVAEAMAKNRCFTVLLSTLNQAVKNERARANLPESHLGILSWKLKVEFREGGSLENAKVASLSLRPDVEGATESRAYELIRRSRGMGIEQKEKGFDPATEKNNQQLAEWRDWVRGNPGEPCSLHVDILGRFVNAIIEDLELSVEEREVDHDVMNSAI